jgi:hypothetical protein
MHVTEFPEVLRGWMEEHSVNKSDPTAPPVTLGQLLQLDMPVRNVAPSEVQFMPFKSGEDGGVAVVRQGSTLRLYDVLKKSDGRTWSIRDHQYLRGNRKSTVTQRHPPRPIFHPEHGDAPTMTCYEPAEASKYGLEVRYNPSCSG